MVMTGVSKLAPGYDSVCAIKTDGTVWCWGSNSDGQVGDGSYTTQLVPVQLPGLTNVKDIAAGGGHVCVVKMDGSVACWGYDGQGQLADGDQYSPDPTPARLVCE
jgi:alpha-tubulin suppressor-like RCC1 family protein